jgi:hypothetical protein
VIACAHFLGDYILRSGSSRFADTAAVTAAFALSFGMLAAIAFGFYWLMQPAAVKNPGLAAYQPPPKTVVTYVPWVPPPPSTEREVTFAASQAAAETAHTTPVLPPKSEVATAQARATPRQHRRVRVYTAPPVWGYAAPRQFGFRPWF